MTTEASCELGLRAVCVFGPVTPGCFRSCGGDWQEDEEEDDDDAEDALVHPNVALQALLVDEVTIHGQLALSWTECGFGMDGKTSRRVRLDENYRWIEAEYFLGEPMEEKLYAVGVVDVGFCSGTRSASGQELFEVGLGGHFSWRHELCLGKNAKGQQHLGTLLLIVPSSDLEGGLLQVAEAVTAMASATAEECGTVFCEIVCPPATVSTAFMAFVPLDVQLRLTPVTRGSCFVAKAPVFGNVEPLGPERRHWEGRDRCV